jgi:hypothetical protein
VGVERKLVRKNALLEISVRISHSEETKKGEVFGILGQFKKLTKYAQTKCVLAVRS